MDSSPNHSSFSFTNTTDFLNHPLGLIFPSFFDIFLIHALLITMNLKSVGGILNLMSKISPTLF